jgi:hypothetical protein
MSGNLKKKPIKDEAVYAFCLFMFGNPAAMPRLCIGV